MTESWPTTEIDAVRRLRVMAASVPRAIIVERVIPAPFERVWGFAGNLERNLPKYVPEVSSIRLLGPLSNDAEADHFRAHIRAFALEGEIAVILRPGWCWMQSKYVLVGMAARPEGNATRFARLHAWRIPGATVAAPIVRLLAGRELRRLERLILAVPPSDGGR